VTENRGAPEAFLPEELLPGDTQPPPQATWKDIAAMILAVLSIAGPILLLMGAVMAVLLRIAGV
jgi:hypothetical protein